MAVYEQDDYYRDQIVGEEVITAEFQKWSWPFPAQLFTLKNDSALVDLEYSFTGNKVSGRLRKGTEPDPYATGDGYNYPKADIMEIWIRIAEGEVLAEGQVANYRLWAFRGIGER